MKIVSLLPSATEIVYALGLDDELAAVSVECDYPEAARAKPVVTGTALAPTSGAREIDDAVRRHVAAGEPLYRLDVDRIREIRPDVILTQDLCRVCAVPAGAVTEALDRLGGPSTVVTLNPARLADVLDDVRRVGAVTARAEQAAAVTAGLQARLDAVRSRVRLRPAVPVLALEWSDPPFRAGHWIPDMIETAGGIPLLAETGARSVELSWPDIARCVRDARPVVVVMPCGHDLAGAVTEAQRLSDRAELAAAAAIWAVDADSCFSRPGPRVVDGVESLADLLHADRADGAVRVR